MFLLEELRDFFFLWTLQVGIFYEVHRAHLQSVHCVICVQVRGKLNIEKE